MIFAFADDIIESPLYIFHCYYTIIHQHSFSLHYRPRRTRSLSAASHIIDAEEESCWQRHLGRAQNRILENWTRGLKIALNPRRTSPNAFTKRRRNRSRYST